jgi:hypothetical protein
MKVLIVGSAPALAMDVRNGVALGGTGAEWAKLLRAKGGPFATILGYRNAPILALQQDSVRNIGQAMAKGLSNDQWAQVWLRNNIAGAVAMDRNGYWWVEERSLFRRSRDFLPLYHDKYDIKGPATIV